MTDLIHEQIDEMEAGREMDKIVASQIMGVRLCKHEADEHGKCIHCGLNKSYFNRIVPPAYYSTDISAAWEVVGKMREWKPELYIGIEEFELKNKGRVYWCHFWDGEAQNYSAEDISLMVAICKAALKAVIKE